MPISRDLCTHLASQLAPLPTKLKKHLFRCFLNVSLDITNVCAQFCCCLNCALLVLAYKIWCEQSTSVATPPRLATRPFADKIKKTPFQVFFKILVRAKGLEPSTSTLARLRSSQLSYARFVWGILTYIFSFCK